MAVEVSKEDKVAKQHLPWDRKDWECADHKNTATHSLWSPPSSEDDMMAAQRRLTNQLERMWWDKFGLKKASDMGTYYGKSRQDYAADMRLYRLPQELLKQPMGEQA